jgi:hypothetical protein
MKISFVKTLMLASTFYFLLTFASANEARAQGLPPGSYQQTCNVIKIDSVKMTAVCKSKAGKTKLNKDFKYKYCVGDLSNQDGYLSCAKNQDLMKADADQAAAEAEQKKLADEKAKAEAEAKAAAEAKAQEKADAAAALDAAKPAFAGAAVMVLGREGKASENAKWFDLMKADSAFAQQAAEGVKFTDTVAFLKKYISQPSGAALRAEKFTDATRRPPSKPFGTRRSRRKRRGMRRWFWLKSASSTKTKPNARR